MQKLGGLVCSRTLLAPLPSTRNNITFTYHSPMIIGDYSNVLQRIMISKISTMVCQCFKSILIKKLHTTEVFKNRKIDKSRVPVLNEDDLEEGFVRGSGPGGQSVNRTSSACHLKHIPTGFVVKCHESRILHENRKKARLLLIEKLDQLYNGEMSVAAQIKRLKEDKSSKAQQKFRKKQLMKQMWKEREGID